MMINKGNLSTNQISQEKKLSNQEKGALKKLRDKNKVVCVNDTDKNLGAANADTCDVKTECRI